MVKVLNVADPEHFEDSTDISRKFPGITLKAIQNTAWMRLHEAAGNQAFLGQNIPELTDVYALPCSLAYTGTRLFAHTLTSTQTTPVEFWRCVYSGRVETSRRLVVIFKRPTDYISVDIIGYYAVDPPQGWSLGKMEVISSAGQVLDTCVSGQLKRGEVGSITCRRNTADIAFMTLYGHDGYGHEDFGVYIDNFRYHTMEPVHPQPPVLRK